ncbi:MAG: sigma-70 family RNA polymerase sigma factor, partial [Kangiellaceae bacterium]|nr:sigma-70 family RNA polymerase sigma factor [Kangiellaceae bacterium]
MSGKTLPDHFFRREYGKLIAVLSRRFGGYQIEAIEDAVQNALVKSIEQWTYQELPENPSAWLFTVAKNNLLNELRNQSSRTALIEQHSLEINQGSELNQNLEPSYFLSQEINDDLLNLLFVGCDKSLPLESQIVFTLRILCGFSIDEIAERLFISKQNTYKRLQRAKNKLRNTISANIELSFEEKTERLSTVVKVLYLMFTEGYFSSHADFTIRQELCEEALRLGEILANNKLGQKPEPYALLALINLHFARLPARQDHGGGLLLLEEQDRTKWRAEFVQTGLFWLSKSATGEKFTGYHAEAGIAAEYCLASSYSTIRWDKVVENYQLLERFNPSPLHFLNRIIATAEWKGAKHALAILEEFEAPTWL